VCPGVVTSGLELAQGVLNILAMSLLDEHVVGVFDLTMELVRAGEWAQATKGCATRQLRGMFVHAGEGK